MQQANEAQQMQQPWRASLNSFACTVPPPPSSVRIEIAP